jgi:hypothetical protein
MKLLKERLYEEEFIYFKGPSEEKIRKRLEGLTLLQKLNVGINNKVKWLIEECIREGALDNLSLKEKFLFALENDIPWLIEECIKDGIDPSDALKFQIKNYAIWNACERDETEIVKILLKDKRVNPMVNDGVTLYWACHNNNLDMVKLLINDKRMDLSAENNKIIKWAYRFKHYDIVKQLLKDPRVIKNLTDEDVFKFRKYIK